MSADDEEDLQDNSPENICAYILNFLGTGPLNLAQHAFKTSPITFMSTSIEKTYFS